MIAIIIFIVWVTGSILSYLSVRKKILNNEEKWTAGDRRFTLILSLASWAALLAVILDEFDTSNSKPAKW